MKKGISLIVLVITIIVMIIIAGAIIISLNSANVIDSAKQATLKADLANAKYVASLTYSKIMIANNDSNNANDYTKATAEAQYKADLAAAGYAIDGGSAAVTTPQTIDAVPAAASTADRLIVTVDANLIATITLQPSDGSTPLD